MCFDLFGLYLPTCSSFYANATKAGAYLLYIDSIWSYRFLEGRFACHSSA